MRDRVEEILHTQNHPDVRWLAAALRTAEQERDRLKGLNTELSQMATDLAFEVARVGCERDAALARVGTLEDVVFKCGAKFSEYEAMHLAKGTPEGDQKAAANREMAMRCAVALGACSICGAMKQLGKRCDH